MSKNPHIVGISPSNQSSVQGDPHGLLAHSQSHSGSGGGGGGGGPGNSTLNQATNSSLQTMSPKAMNTMHHFTEFVKAFCDFGSEMVHLVRLTTGKNHRIMFSSSIKLDDSNLGGLEPGQTCLHTLRV